MKRTSSLVALLAFVLLLLIFAPLSLSAAPRLTITESFMNNTAPGWIFPSGTNTACLTAAGGPNSCTSVSDPNGSGWLRLTDAGTSTAGTIVYNTPFSSNEGVTLTFDYATYGGTGADGLTFYLIDGATTTPTIGAPGAALGYSRDTGRDFPGVTNGIVGIGLDEYGHFVTNIAGGCAAIPCLPTTPNQIAIRGSGSLNTGFNLLANASQTIATGSRATPNTVRMTVINGNIKVEVSVNGGPFNTVINNFNYEAATGQVLTPPTLKLGLSASTGDLTDIHEIRLLTIGSVLINSSTSLVQDLATTSPFQSFKLTATVTGTGGTPTGNVTFFDGASPISSCAAVALSGGVATCNAAFSIVGSHTLSAQYNGDSTFGRSQSNSLIHVVTAPTSIFLPLNPTNGNASMPCPMPICFYDPSAP